MSFLCSPQKERIEKIKDKLSQIQQSSESAKGTLLDETEQQVKMLEEQLEDF